MNYYYLDAGNQPAGPLSLDEIRRKAAAGEIPAQPLVAAVGSSQWQPLDAGSMPAAKAGFPVDQMLSNATALVVRGAREGLSAGLLERTLDLARRGGHFIVAAGAGLGIVYAIFAAVKNGTAMVFVSALLLLVCLAFAHYAARYFLHANETLLTPTRVSTAALLDCLALLALIVAVSSVVSAVTVWIKFGVWQAFAPSVLLALLWTAFVAVALHPGLVKVEIGPSGAGEQLVGLLAFVFKAQLKLVPLVFLILGALGLLVIGLSFFDKADYVLGLVPHQTLPLPAKVDGSAGGFGGMSMIILACLLPFLAHLFFITVSLPLELWRAILTVPAKLDALKH